MKFPLLNVTDKNWNEVFDLTVFVLFDRYIYKDKEVLFHKYYKNKIYCDADGKLYKVIDSCPPTEFWRNILKFIPNVFRVTLTFESLDKFVS